MSSHPPKPPTALVILDGFGYQDESAGNATRQAHMQAYNALLKNYPNTFLAASGIAAGLPQGVMGNSEVGHLTIGAGRVVPSPLSLLPQAIHASTALKVGMARLTQTNNALHLIGLVSDAGVHSHISHLKELLSIATQYNVKKVYVHAILDGRDTPPKSAQTFLKQLDANIASLHGRFYAMDRDNNTQRTQTSFDVLGGNNSVKTTWENALQEAYTKGETDEFITPVLLNKDATIKEGDGVIMFNFRPDRSRQLAYLIGTKIKTAFFFTATNYEKKQNQTQYAQALLKRQPVHNTLLDVLHKSRKKVLIVAETEKYAHVTYFFIGGMDRALPMQKRVLVPSIKAKNYIEHPEMRAGKITDEVVQSLQNDPRDFYLINFANADMVGHSGNLQATTKACEVLDQQLKVLVAEIVEKRNGTLFICSDHGNAEEPGVMHTTNQVPFIAVGKGFSDKLVAKVESAYELQHIAPIVLDSMGLCVPDEML